MKINTIITAGGTSQRYGTENKLFAPVGTSNVLIESIKPFLSFDNICKVIVSIEPSYADEFLIDLSNFGVENSDKIKICMGGKSRTESVKNALVALDDDADIVLIHDGARPFVDTDTIQSVIDGADECGASLPVLALTDALVSLADNCARPVDRALYGRVQTPAGFHKDRLAKAYKKAKTDFYDDISVVQTYAFGQVKIIAGKNSNRKITTKDDLTQSAVGCGYDIHRLQEGTGITLCGKHFDTNTSFVAHSDGDVPVHALMDAILTAMGKKDIGHYFPVDDPKYDNINSFELLATVLDIAKTDGYSLINTSITIIAKEPMLSPHIREMQNNLSHILNIPASCIGISATTNEEVGEIGDGRAIASFATVLLNKN